MAPNYMTKLMWILIIIFLTIGLYSQHATVSTIANTIPLVACTAFVHHRFLNRRHMQFTFPVVALIMLVILATSQYSDYDEAIWNLQQTLSSLAWPALGFSTIISGAIVYATEGMRHRRQADRVINSASAGQGSASAGQGSASAGRILLMLDTVLQVLDDIYGDDSDDIYGDNSDDTFPLEGSSQAEDIPEDNLSDDRGSDGSEDSLPNSYGPFPSEFTNPR